MGRYEEALEFTMKAVECAYGGRPEYHARAELNSASHCARMGSSEKARKILDEGIERFKMEKRYIPPSYLAAVYGWLGDKDRAFSLLEQAYEERDRWMKFLKIDPQYDSLRDDPRFKDLLRRIWPEK